MFSNFLCVWLLLSFQYTFISNRDLFSNNTVLLQGSAVTYSPS